MQAQEYLNQADLNIRHGDASVHKFIAEIQKQFL